MTQIQMMKIRMIVNLMNNFPNHIQMTNHFLQSSQIGDGGPLHITRKNMKKKIKRKNTLHSKSLIKRIISVHPQS